MQKSSFLVVICLKLSNSFQHKLREREGCLHVEEEVEKEGKCARHFYISSILLYFVDSDECFAFYLLQLQDKQKGRASQRDYQQIGQVKLGIRPVHVLNSFLLFSCHTEPSFKLSFFFLFFFLQIHINGWMTFR